MTDDDSTGNKMELIWNKGYNGSRLEYIDLETYCFVNGKTIITSGNEKPFVFPETGISAFAVHKQNKHIAVGSRGLDPDIHIYTFPSFEILSTLQSCAKLEYSILTFSSTDYLASLSGIPDFQLSIWNYKESLLLCSMKMPDEIPTSLSFNYGNWCQLGVTYTNNIYSCNIVKCHTYMELDCEILTCPPISTKPVERKSESSTLPIKSVYEGFHLTEAAKAGEIGERAEELIYLLENIPRVTPLSQCWLASGVFYIGCKEGHILKVDVDSNSTAVLLHPSDYKDILDHEEKEPVDEIDSVDKYSIDFIAIHRIGLFAATKTGMICQFDVFGEYPKLLRQYNTNISISTFTMSLDYKKILVGSTLGNIQLHDVNKLDQIEFLSNESSSPFIDAKCAYPGTDTAVTIQKHGLVQLWNIKTGENISSLFLHKTLCTMSSSPVSYIMAIGCASGHLCIIDVQILIEPRLIYCIQLCNFPLTHVHFDYNGEYLLSMSEGNTIFIQDGSAINGYQIYGFLNTNGYVLNLTTDSSQGVDVYLSICSEKDKKENGADVLCIFQLDEDFKKNYTEKYLTPECDFDPFKVQIKYFTLLSPIQGLTILHREAFVHSQKSHKIVKLPLNEEMQADLSENQSEILFAQESYDCHELPGIDLLCSDDQKWLLSCGKDGILQLCLTNDMNKSVVKCSTHDFYQGCAKSLCLTPDCQYVLLTSNDGTISCYQIIYKSSDALENVNESITSFYNKKDMTKTLVILESRAVGKRPTLETLEVEAETINKEEVKPEPKTETETETETSTTDSEPSFENIVSPPLTGSWIELQKAKNLHEKNKQFAPARKHIKDSITQMRKTVKKMLTINENLPEIEQLERYEFDLDVEEQTRLQQEAKEAVLRVYEKIEYENLAKLFLKNVIKNQCFDDMKVKGRTLKAFLISLEVTNFPLIERSQKRLKNLEIFKQRRHIEMQVDEINQEIMEVLSQTVITSSDSQLSEEFSEESPVSNKGEQSSITEGELEAEESGKESKEDEILEDDASSTQTFEKPVAQVEEKPKPEEVAPVVIQDLPSTAGSLGAFYGGSCEYLYNQFDLHSRYQKIAQVILLQDVLYRIKETFNKEFDELYQRKELEISRIKEKNKRITQIINDLQVDENVYVPDMGIHEKPELLLIVEDSEVKTEKYLTPEQRKALEEKMAEDELKKKNKADGVRDRALNQMMNGVLEIKKEDELKKDIPVPNITVNEDEWTEEELKIMREYERKVKELNEEREKYRKNLESELKKLQGSIVESMSTFDELLNNLFQKHIQVIKTIHQEEQKINRIKLNLMVQNVLDCHEQELLKRKQDKIDAQTALFNVLAKSEKMISDYRTTYDQTVAEDKTFEKSFKNEFPGTSQVMVDTLHKLFRKRPKAYKFKVPESAAETDITNIFNEHPSTSQQKSQYPTSIESTLEEMDRFTYMPEGLDPKVWMKFCHIRRTKFSKELQVRNSALTLADMNAFHQEKMEEQERVRNETDEIEAELKKLKKTRQQFDIDIEIQLLLKQGQVELETETFIYNFSDSVLIHRCIVEELNSKIKEFAEQKIASMEESKDFKKGIFQQEWEHRKMMMQMEDLRQKMNDIQYLKVTREVQEYLELEDYDGKKTFETEQLERSLIGLREIHKIKLKKIADDTTKMRLLVHQKQKDNESLSRRIEILNVEVNDRHHIADVSTEKRECIQAEKKYRAIKQRKRMVDLAKSQAAELAVLRKEVERLRMKTFPALI